MSTVHNTATPAAATTSAIKHLNYTHEAMADLIISEPTVTARELGEIFNYSPGWVSRVIASDAFQARLAQRKAQLTDPIVAASLDERLRSVAIHSMTIIEEKLSTDESPAFAIDALGLASAAMASYGRGRA
jgi:hypothetical protein